MKTACFLFLFLFQSVFAQHPVSINLDDSDGLPNASFYDILEDNNGFIWLATGKGLFRYDGENYKSYTNDKLKGLSVFRLKLDNNNKVWCTSLSGQIFYIKNDKLTLFIDLKENKFNNIDIVNFSLYKDRVFFIGDKKLNAIKKQDSKNKNIKTYKGLYKNIQLINDSIFVFNKITKNVDYYNENLDKFIPYINDKLKVDKKIKVSFFTYKDDFYCRLIYEDFSERVFIKKGGHFRPFKNSTQIIDKRIENIKTIDSLIWVATNKGVDVIRNFGGENIKINTYFEDYKITNVIKDKNSNYWFTTLRDGIFVIPNIHLSLIEFPKLLNRVTDIDKINSNTFAFGTDNGKFGTYDFETKKIVTYPLKDEVRISEVLYHPKLEKVFISTDNGSYIFDYKEKKVYDKNSTFLNAKGLSVMDNNSVLYSNHVGSFIINTNNNNLDIQTLKRGKRAYKSFYSAKTKTSYVAYVDNLISYDENLKPTIIRNNNEIIYVINIAETVDGVIWVSTFKNGLFGIKNNQIFVNYTTKNGLVTNQPKGIRADGNKLWIVTEKGIQLFDTHKKTFKLLTRSDGVLSYSIFDIQVYANFVLFASNKGLFSINKETIFKEKITANPYFVSITIAGNEEPIKEEYTLKYNQNKINIKFNTTGFRSIDNTKYQYKMKGFNDNWENIKKGVNEVAFNSLPYGNYTFQLRVKNGNDFSDIKELKFHINEVFYKKGWFIILLFLLFGLLLNKYNKYQASEKEKVQNLVLEKKQNDLENVALKLENLRSQMNPHFIFNALNSIQEFIITNHKNMAGDFLGKFADLIRIYLDQSNKDKISVSEEIETLQKYLELEKLRFEDTFNYSIITNNFKKYEQALIPTMLIQPYVENALKHGLLHRKTGRLLSIDFDLIDDGIICIITDNGVGRKKVEEIQSKSPKRHTSFATKASQDRLKLMNYNNDYKIEIEIIDLYDGDKAKGTKVVINIPIQEV